MSDPRHIAIIMDGNGRWAQQRKLPRIAGHKAGMETLHKIVRYAGERGLEWLTLFAFSSENWSRPNEEVIHLMGLLKFFIRRDLSELHSRNVRILVIGGKDNLPDDIAKMLQEATDMTADNSGLNLVIAFNYGARQEIARAARRIAIAVERGELKSCNVTGDTVSSYLDTADMPDPDLIIRTSGEMRLSNFLLWQAAYAEMYFTDVFWPDFSPQDFDRAIMAYRCRDRRFGALGADEERRSALL